MRGLPSILSLFGNKFDKFHNTGDQIYYINLKTLKIVSKRQDFPSSMLRYNGRRYATLLNL